MKQLSPSSEKIQWELEVPLLTNRFIMYDLGKTVIITGLILFLLLSIVSLAVDRKVSLDALAGWGKLTAIATLGLFLLMVLVMILFFLNRFPMRFTLSPRGAQVESLSRVGKWGNRLAVILGALSGKPQVAGAGLLGIAQEVVSLKWDEVCHLNIHPRAQVISLRNNWRVVFRLYCTPENFASVKAAVQEWAEQGRLQRDRTAAKAGPSPLPRQLFLSFITLIAGLSLAALPLEVPAALKVAVTLVGLLAVWLPGLSRLGGALTLFLAVSVVAIFIGRGLENRQLFQESDYRRFAASQGLKLDKVPEWALFKSRRFKTFHPGEWAATGVAGLGLTFLSLLGLAGMRGKLLNRK